MKRYNNLSISTRLTVSVASILALIMVVLLVVTSITNYKSLIKGTDESIYGLVETNNVISSNVISGAEETTALLANYIGNKLETVNSATVGTSKVFNTSVPADKANIEQYFIDNITSTMKSNKDIAGMGVFYEPYGFDSSIKDYTMYISAKDVDSETIQTYGEYSGYGDESYYKIAKDSNKFYLTEPYADQGITMITACYPIESNGKVVGVVTADIDVNIFKGLKLNTAMNYKSMECYVLSDTGTLVYSSVDKEAVSKEPGTVFKSINKDKLEAQKLKSSGNLIYASPIKVENQIWWIIADIDNSEVMKPVLTQTVTQCILLLLSAVLLCVGISVMVRKTLKPLQQISLASNELGKGNFNNINLPDYKYNDEVGTLNDSFKLMAKCIEQVIFDIKKVCSAYSQGDFTTELDDLVYIGEFDGIRQALHKISSNLSKTIDIVKTSALQVSIGAEQFSNSSQLLSMGSIEQASVTENILASVNRLTGSVNTTYDLSKEIKSYVTKVDSELSASNNKMIETAESMNNIKCTSEEIRKIIKTIEDIAFKTNILALNAAVEAARAGDAGKGFAVVADEVRNLAGQSAEAAKSTNELILNAISAIEQGNSVVIETATALEETVESTKELVKAIDEVTASAESQVTDLNEVSNGMYKINGIVQSHAATAEETAAGSEELQGQASLLSDETSKFIVSADS